MAAAVAAAHLEEVAGSGLGQEVLQRTVAAGGEIGQSAHLAGFGGIDVEFVVVGLFGGGADVVAEQLLKDRLGEALALLGVIGAAIGGAGLVVAAGKGAVHHLVQLRGDLLGGGGAGGGLAQAPDLRLALIACIQPYVVAGDGVSARHIQVAAQLGLDQIAAATGDEAPPLGVAAVVLPQLAVGLAGGAAARHVHRFPGVGVDDLAPLAGNRDNLEALRRGAVGAVDLNVGPIVTGVAAHVQHQVVAQRGVQGVGAAEGDRAGAAAQVLGHLAGVRPGHLVMAAHRVQKLGAAAAGAQDHHPVALGDVAVGGAAGGAGVGGDLGGGGDGGEAAARQVKGREGGAGEPGNPPAARDRIADLDGAGGHGDDPALIRGAVDPAAGLGLEGAVGVGVHAAGGVQRVAGDVDAGGNAGDAGRAGLGNQQGDHGRHHQQHQQAPAGQVLDSHLFVHKQTPLLFLSDVGSGYYRRLYGPRIAWIMV